jgi:hypothetical protein
MKTPEELAKEYVHAWWGPREDNMTLATRQAFLAGYSAGSDRTDAELLKAFLDIKEKDSLGPKLAAFINGMRRGLKQVRDYDENT